MIEVRGLTKQYGDLRAVDDLTFSVTPGVVTGFLGPNGSGKTTTMRMVLGLARPTAGDVTILGRSYADTPAPLREVGALLDAKAVHGRRKAKDHLLGLALSNGIGRRRVDEVLGIVGLESVANKRTGTFSLGMFQRLGIAAALLGDPPVVMFDEPVNGLDPDGILWVRNFMRSLADEGRTVLVSSHLLSEMSLTADHLVVVGRGRLITDVSTEGFIASSGVQSVRVRVAEASSTSFANRLGSAGGHISQGADGTLTVTGMESEHIGALAVADGVVLSELTPQRASLEQVFMERTEEFLDYHAEGATT